MNDKIRDEKHRRFIADLPCCMCGQVFQTQCAHIRVGNDAGMGLKSGDDCTVPLCVKCHASQHATSERKFWGNKLLSAKWLATSLYNHTGNASKGHQLIARFRCLVSGS